jgi:hypothetical protein
MRIPSSGAVSWHPSRMPASVPHPCQKGQKTAVASGHPGATQTASDLGMRRLTPCAKRTPGQYVMLPRRFRSSVAALPAVRVSLPSDGSYALICRPGIAEPSQRRGACHTRATRQGVKGATTVTHGHSRADNQHRRSRSSLAGPRHRSSKLVVPSPRCTIVPAMSDVSRPGRYAVAPRALTRRPRPEGWQLSRERGRSRAGGGVHVERLETPLVTYPICARICARDAAGRIETGEMPTLDADVAPPVDRGQHDDWRRPERPETHVVWLITQRSRVQIPPPLPRPEASSN